MRALVVHVAVGANDMHQKVTIAQLSPLFRSGINESGDPRVERAKNWTIYGAGRCHQLGFFC